MKEMGRETTRHEALLLEILDVVGPKNMRPKTNHIQLLTRTVSILLSSILEGIGGEGE